MTAKRDLDTILAAWLDAGPTDLPDATRRAIATSIPTITQARRGRFAPRRLVDMTSIGRLAAVAFVAVVAIAGALYLVNMRPGPGGPSASVAASTLATTSPTVSLDTATWTAFSSTAFGYDARYPAGWVATTGTRQGSATELALGEPVVSMARFWDHFDADGAEAGARLLATSSALPEGMSEDAWIAAYQAPQVEQAGRACIPDRSTWTAVTIDGRSGEIYVGCQFAEAMTFVEGRVYVFSYTDFSNARDVSTTGRALLEAFLGSVSIDPSRIPMPTVEPS